MWYTDNVKNFAFKNIFFVLLILSFISCSKKDDSVHFELGNQIYWAATTAESSIESVEEENLNFQLLQNFQKRRLKKLVSEDCEYLWLKIPFIVPENFKNQDSSLVIPYLHFADKVYLNGTFVGEYGKFPPNEYPVQFQCHTYILPKKNLQEENTLYVKVFLKGKAKISEDIFITTNEDAYAFTQRLSFMKSRVYKLFAGMMGCAFFLFFFLYLLRKKNKEYLYLSLINLLTICFVSAFFAPDMPIFYSMSYFTFMKLNMCISLYFIMYFYGNFVFNFLGTPESKLIFIVRRLLLTFQIFVTAFAPTYEYLMKITVLMLALCGLQVLYPTFQVFKLFRKPETKQLTLRLLLNFIVLFIMILLDFIFHVVLKRTNIPFFSIFGWQTTIFGFMILLAVQYVRFANENEYLSNNLQKEVALKTKALTAANMQLQIEKIRSNKDLELAASIQKKFLPSSQMHFDGWDLAVEYLPLAKVSGDFYDLYNYGSELKGFSIFDVSGHGIPASLVTMLGKHIVSTSFYESLKTKETMAETLMNINEVINQEKGDIDNYLTGLLFEVDGNKIQFANAGHPQPIIYKAKTKEVQNISSQDLQFGAIGISGIDVSFADFDFVMEEGDILLCFTDGLNEAKNIHNEDFGRKNIMDVLCSCAEKTSQEILNELMKTQRDFVGEATIDDDVTVLVLKRT